MTIIVLAPESVEAVALRVVELLDEQQTAPTGMVDAATLAKLLAISRSSVYEHAQQLGGVRLGDGNRPRLRFDPEIARQAWTRRVGREESQCAEAAVRAAPRRRRRRQRSGSEADLLPVKHLEPVDVDFALLTPRCLCEQGPELGDDGRCATCAGWPE